MRKVAIAPIAGILLAGLTSTVAATNAGTNACSSAAPCLSGINSAPAGSSGAGVKGMAINSYGVRGISTNSTALLGQSASGVSYEPGVEGESTYTGSGSVYDAAGGFGLTALTGGHVPQLGVIGVGLTAGLSGENFSSSSAISTGVLGTDYTGNAAGVVGESDGTSTSTAGVGVAGMLTAYDGEVNGVAVYGKASGSAHNQSDDEAFGGYFVSNATAQSQSEYNIGLGVEGSTVAAQLYNPAASQEVDVADTEYLIFGSNSNKTAFSVDSMANVVTSGTVTGSNISTPGDAMYRQSGASGSTLIAYGMRSSAPELEDVGGAQLVNGRAIVHIDPKLADVMDPHAVYRVFLTPDGDSKGLYVSQKTPSSFVVAEQQGGHSTMSFDYRIVATPYGHTRERLAVAPPLERRSAPLAMDRNGGNPMHLPSFITSPDRALRASLGTQRYANLIAAKRRELARP